MSLPTLAFSPSLSHSISLFFYSSLHTFHPSYFLSFHYTFYFSLLFLSLPPSPPLVLSLPHLFPLFHTASIPPHPPHCTIQGRAGYKIKWQGSYVLITSAPARSFVTHVFLQLHLFTHTWPPSPPPFSSSFLLYYACLFLPSLSLRMLPTASIQRTSPFPLSYVSPPSSFRSLSFHLHLYAHLHACLYFFIFSHFTPIILSLLPWPSTLCLVRLPTSNILFTPVILIALAFSHRHHCNSLPCCRLIRGLLIPQKSATKQMP